MMHPGAQFNSEFRSLVKSEIAKLTADDTVATRASGCIEAEKKEARLHSCLSRRTKNLQRRN